MEMVCRVSGVSCLGLCSCFIYLLFQCIIDAFAVFVSGKVAEFVLLCYWLKIHGTL